MSRTFSGEVLRSILRGTEPDYEVVENEINGTSRWSVHYTMVFKELSTGKLYRTHYSEGATEYQDEDPFEYEDELEVDEVEPYEETVIKYRTVVPF